MTLQTLDGLRLLGQGRAAEVFELDATRVVKVARAGNDSALEREAMALRAAHAAGAPVPAVLDVSRFDDRSGIVMERVAGRDMLSDLGRRPWTLVRVGAKLGRLHAQLHAVTAPAQLPTVTSYVRERLTTSTVPAPVRDKVLAILSQLPEGDRLCHLDFHPGNVIRDGAAMTVIDWSTAARGDPHSDIALTMLGLQGGEAPPGTPWLTRVFEPLGRRVIVRGYVKSYRRHAALDDELLASWRIIAAGVRMTYEIAGEQKLLAQVIAEA